METVRTAVVIETSRHRIRGNVSVADQQRLSDYVNELGRDFFAVTQAHIAPLDAPDRERAIEFILVARHEIAVILPGEAELEDEARNSRGADFWTFMSNETTAV